MSSGLCFTTGFSLYVPHLGQIVVRELRMILVPQEEACDSIAGRLLRRTLEDGVGVVSVLPVALSLVVSIVDNLSECETNQIDDQCNGTRDSLQY